MNAVTAFQPLQNFLKCSSKLLSAACAAAHSFSYCFHYTTNRPVFQAFSVPYSTYLHIIDQLRISFFEPINPCIDFYLSSSCDLQKRSLPTPQIIIYRLFRYKCGLKPVNVADFASGSKSKNSSLVSYPGFYPHICQKPPQNLLFMKQRSSSVTICVSAHSLYFVWRHDKTCSVSGSGIA